MSIITREQAKDLRNAFQCWQQDYDPVEDKEQYYMFGLGMVAMDALLASLEPVSVIKIDHESSLIKHVKRVVSETNAPPAPVSVPDAMEMDDDFDSAFEHGKAVGWNACRAAILQGAENAELRCSIQTAPALDSSPKIAELPSGNSPVIPDGWKLVPIDPTKDMLRAGQSVVGFWLNTVHCYSKMLAAAPAAPQQEVK
ncbi:hypothetical protein VB296_00635 [Enterobacter cloacae]|uniref:hypothetical protein n=1 Tax=Enterobacter cloacae TaxID=550 RepID=UPI002B206682|nr:hypothetical protein [Enterobacter cloacae]MEA5221383.1 hypothetical protein [Enterobacter cloacae]